MKKNNDWPLAAVFIAMFIMFGVMAWANKACASEKRTCFLCDREVKDGHEKTRQAIKSIEQMIYLYQTGQYPTRVFIKHLRHAQKILFKSLQEPKKNNFCLDVAKQINQPSKRSAALISCMDAIMKKDSRR